MKRLIGLIAILLLALPVAATAQNGNGGQPQYWITGGGQVIGENQLNGPGDTIAFTAQLLDSGDARGQLQVIERDSGAEQGRGKPVVKFHGTVTCVESTGPNSGRFGGYLRGTDFDDYRHFVVDVMDADDQGNDTIAFRQVVEDDYEEEQQSPCDLEAGQGDLRETRLARGSLKIHERNGNGE
jgi:hypothetical protein